jgi:hypothetical protein
MKKNTVNESMNQPDNEKEYNQFNESSTKKQSKEKNQV